MNKCDNCVHRSEEEIYNYQVCIRCAHNPFAVDDKFTAREPQIVPKEAGESWERHGIKYFTYNTTIGLAWISEVGDIGLINHSNSVIHGRDGWERKCPEVPDPNIERVVDKKINLMPDILSDALNLMDTRGRSIPTASKALFNFEWEELRKLIFASLEMSEKARETL